MKLSRIIIELSRIIFWRIIWNNQKFHNQELYRIIKGAILKNYCQLIGELLGELSK